ncbi:ThuA domain-containing protein [Streptomyces sp. MAR4 CNX-425]|uniref:ThuA domain-containing protein n=1 Tax=Streptomyces sp. MAR4 CNX-425 TaxID=3406343 RepID=UPI003B50F746
MRRRGNALRWAAGTSAVAMTATLLAGAQAVAGPPGGGPLAAGKPPGQSAAKVLVFTRTDGHQHPVTQAGVEAIEAIGAQGPETFTVTATDRVTAFTDKNLAKYNAVVFLSPGSDRLNTMQERSFQRYVEAGGGFLGIHGAARSEPESDWFTGLIGARPAGNSGDAQEAVVEVGDRLNPATRDLPLTWSRSDVWTNWENNPSGSVHTVARVRERSYEPGPSADGWDHPISWCRDYEGGRSFYTGMGGTAAGFAEENFRSHLRGALLWTTRQARADCQASITGNYEATRLTQPNQPEQLDQIGEPHGIDIAEDGKVYYIGRGGRWSGAPVDTDWNSPEIGKGPGTLHMWDPETEQVTEVGTLDVFGNKGGGDELIKVEEGLLGIALDPDFAANGHVYLHYTPHSGIDRDARMAERRVSRFTIDPATQKLDTSSEKVLLSWPVQVHSCCHAGGDMEWDSKGNLYIATGDNNSSRFSDGYSGNNPEPNFGGVSFADARRTAGNTNNLNGKILRIHPEPDGTYTIPEGNLFTGDEGNGDQARPEIYVMGVRNPSRIEIDERDWLYAGWVGPDAGQPSTTWGPAKYDTFAVITSAGNQGWPYCMGNKQPYRDRNLPDPTQPLDWYDCDNLKNTSPNNDGLTDIPPARDNNIWYSPQGGAPDYPRNADGLPSYNIDEAQYRLPWLKGGGQAAMTGPVYRYDASSDSDVKWPEYWDDKWFVGDFYDQDQPRHAVVMDPDNAGDGGLPVHAESLDDIVPAGDGGIRNLMDWKFGPDGALYVLDYGRGFFNADSASALWRVTYKGGPPTPLPENLIKKGSR